MPDKTPSAKRAPKGEVFQSVPVFRVGDYGPKGKYSRETLEQIAADYDPAFLEAPVTVDHASSGPALGWIWGLSRDGDVLMADMDIREEFASVVRDGAFKKRSVEIYRKQDKTGRPYLKALSFLGAAAPAVKGLPDLQFSEGADSASVDFEERDPDDVAAENFAAVKTDGGAQYPPEAYLVTPDLQKPSGWRLRTWESPEKKVTRKQLGRVSAAFSPGGHGGNRVDLPDDTTRQAKLDLRGLYRSIDVPEAEIPFEADDKEWRNFSIFHLGKRPSAIKLEALPQLCPHLFEPQEHVNGYLTFISDATPASDGGEIHSPEEEDTMSDEAKERLEELETKFAEASEKLEAAEKERDALKEEVETGKREAAKAEATRVFEEAKAKSKLPEACLEKLSEQFDGAESPDGITEAFEKEEAFLAKLAEERPDIKGFGPSNSTTPEDADLASAKAMSEEKGISLGQAAVEVARQAKAKGQ